MNIDALRARLREAFGKIKLEQENLIKNIDAVKTDVSAVKSDYVGKEKLNLLKLKIGEINETLKKIWDLEQDIKTLDEKTVNKNYFSQQMELVGADMEDVKKAVATLNKEYVSEFQVKELIENINKEFNVIKENVASIKSIKDSIRSRELRKKTDELHKRVDELKKFLRKTDEDLRSAFKKMEDELRTKAKKTEEELSSQIKKTDSQVLDKIKQSEIKMEKLERNVVDRKEFSQKSRELENELYSVRKELKDLKLVLRDVDSLRGSIKKLEKSPEPKMTRTVVFEGKKEKIVSESSPSKGKAVKVIANVLIALAFLTLVAAVVSFIMKETDITVYTTIGAISAFVVGIIMKIVMFAKGQ